MVEKDMFDLSGRVALITGGGSGIGRSLCEGMAEFGADVAICDINEEWARETAKLIGRFEHRTLVIKGDVSNPRDVEYLVSETKAKLGTIDILINNVGIYLRESKIHEMVVEDWDRTMAVNLRGVFLCMRAVLPVMIKQKKGNIINISSAVGVSAIDPKSGQFISYQASKAAINIMTKQLAVERGPHNIRVNVIAPSFLSTRLTDALIARTGENMKRWIPLGRIGRPDEIRGAVVFLASEASSYVTGQILCLDGGTTAW